jgi:hypothetical protein
VAYKFVLVVLVPVAFTQVMSVRLSGPVRMRFVIVAVVAANVVAVADPVVMELVVRFVMVDEVARRFVMVPVVALRLVTPRLVIFEKVANKLVVVTDTDVTDPKDAFQRLVAFPRENARSVVGMRFELTVPETMRVLVTVRVLAVAPLRMRTVPVVVRSEVVSPPNKERASEVVAPRAVTEARVSASGVTTQPTPFERQMPMPPTVAVAKFAASAYRKEEEAWLKKAFEDEVMPLMEREVPVAFVKVVSWRDVSPVAVRSPARIVPPVMVLAWSTPPVATENWRSPVI